MRKEYLLLAGCLLLIFAAPCMAADGPYVGLHGGAVFLHDAEYTESGGVSYTVEHDPGFMAGGMIGYKEGRGRMEFEVSYRQNDWDDIVDLNVAGVGSLASFEAAGIGVDGHISTIIFLVNAYYDFDNKTPFTPYVMAGIGAAYVELDDLRLTLGGITVDVPGEDDFTFAYQFGAGVSYALGQRVSLSTDYRIFPISNPEFEGTDGEYLSHNIMVGVKYHF